MKKKLIVITLILAMTLSMAACSTKGDEPNPPTDSDNIGQDKENPEDEKTTGGAFDETTTPPAAKPGAGDTATKPNTGGATSKPGTGTQKPQLKGTLEEVMDSIYSGFTFEPSTAITKVSAENQEYYLGSKAKDIKYKRAIASEPMMSSVAHSMVLIEMEDGADIAAAKKTVKDNVDGRKWICVGVEAENILVENIGNVIFLVMSEDSKTIMDQFVALGK